jgi:ribosomal-protein-alanine N-acetyltransferase
VAQPAGPGSAAWQRRWTIDAGDMTLEPATRDLAQAIIAGGPAPREFEEGARHERIPQAMGFAIRDIDSGAAAILPTVWVVVRRADGKIIGDIGTHGPPDSAGCVEIGYSLAPSVRGQGVGTAAVAGLVGRLAAVPGIRRIVAMTGADNTASRRLLERLGFRLDGSPPVAGEVRYALDVSSAGAAPRG